MVECVANVHLRLGVQALNRLLHQLDEFQVGQRGPQPPELRLPRLRTRNKQRNHRKVHTIGVEELDREAMMHWRAGCARPRATSVLAQASQFRQLAEQNIAKLPGRGSPTQVTLGLVAASV